MKNSTRDTAGRARQAFTARSRVAAYLQEACSNDGQLPTNLGEMAQRCITEENLAKLDLVFDADNPGAACYSDLIRELYMEAQGGIHLVRRDSPIQHLRELADDPGISGELYLEMPTIAPLLFADQVAHSANDFDLVWVTIHARYDRAHIDATVSEIIMSHLLDSAATARDMSNAIRALQYSLHEDDVRRLCGLPRVLDDQSARDLMVMVSELTQRCTSFEARVAEIRQRVRATHARRKEKPNRTH